MATEVQTYSDLHDQYWQQVECYKQPAVRTGIKLTALATIVALLVIASVAAYALSHPSSALGTSYSTLGHSGVVALVSAGFVASVVLFVLLQIYLQKSVFRVSDYVHDNQGFLYALKDQEGNVRGYVYGTMHAPLGHVSGIHPQVEEASNACGQVYVECEQSQNAVSKLLGRPQGIDNLIAEHARQNQKSLSEFEGGYKQLRIIFGAFLTAGNNLADELKHTDFKQAQINPDQVSSLFSEVKQLINNLPQFIDSTVVYWQTGSEEPFLSNFTDLFERRILAHIRSFPFLAPFLEIPRILLDKRNENWMPTILDALHDQSKGPVLVAVGSAHLYDFPGIGTTGLLTRLQREGVRVERVPLHSRHSEGGELCVTPSNSSQTDYT